VDTTVVDVVVKDVVRAVLVAGTVVVDVVLTILVDGTVAVDVVVTVPAVIVIVTMLINVVVPPDRAP
jgi:hypothetical protein